MNITFGKKNVTKKPSGFVIDENHLPQNTTLDKNDTFHRVMDELVLTKEALDEKRKSLKENPIKVRQVQNKQLRKQVNNLNQKLNQLKTKLGHLQLTYLKEIAKSLPEKSLRYHSSPIIRQEDPNVVKKLSNLVQQAGGKLVVKLVNGNHYHNHILKIDPANGGLKIIYTDPEANKYNAANFITWNADQITDNHQNKPVFDKHGNLYLDDLEKKPLTFNYKKNLPVDIDRPVNRKSYFAHMTYVDPTTAVSTTLKSDRVTKETQNGKNLKLQYDPIGIEAYSVKRILSNLSRKLDMSETTNSINHTKHIKDQIVIQENGVSKSYTPQELPQPLLKTLTEIIK